MSYRRAGQQTAPSTRPTGRVAREVYRLRLAINSLSAALSTLADPKQLPPEAADRATVEALDAAEQFIVSALPVAERWKAARQRRALAACRK
jgi:hypothetical protein